MLLLLTTYYLLLTTYYRPEVDVLHAGVARTGVVRSGVLPPLADQRPPVHLVRDRVTVTVTARGRVWFGVRARVVVRVSVRAGG